MTDEPIVAAVLNDPVVQAVLSAPFVDRRERPTATGERGQTVAPPSTTEEQDRVTAGQRAVNLLWETTQRDIARWVIGAALLVAGILAIGGRYLGSTELQLAGAVFLFGVANLVTGFYFGRTNHQRQGGIGGNQTTESR